MQVEINLERPQEAVIHFHIRGCPLATLKPGAISALLSAQGQVCWRDNRWAAVLPVKSLTRLPHSVVHQPVSYRNGPARWQ
jgi:hypothetical protein